MGAPGIAVEEREYQTTSTHISPTVPLFIGRFGHDGTNWLAATSPCLFVDNELELRRLFPNSIQATVVIDGDRVSVDGTIVEAGALAISHYFANGGGPCRLRPIQVAGDTGYDTAIDELKEATLLACVLDAATNLKNIHSIAAEYLAAQPGRFYICNMKDKDTAPALPDGHGAHTALYHPYLTLHCRHWRSDDAITVSGHADTDVSTLADLKIVDRALYAVADRELRALQEQYAYIQMPPSAAVAAAYCKTDRERGVWKAPANIVINNATPYERVTDAQQADLNDKGINAIRIIDGQTTIWGARTCEVTDRQWRYINVRRLFNQVQRDVGDIMQRYQGEPNTSATWVRAETTIANYLYHLWQLGALLGQRPQEAYQVTVGLEETAGTVNGDSDDNDDGDDSEAKMIASICLAPSKPAEFIALQVGQGLQ
ncbi:phage tail sheath protein FI [Herbaspirillum sp. YR522]|nr:phage tail sheath protein FI [Herbaspirillum sp. YR522]